MKVCAVDGCARRVKARGWCTMHWSRWRRHGHLGTVDEPGPKPDMAIELQDLDPEPPDECVDCGRLPMPGGVIRCRPCLLADLDRRVRARPQRGARSERRHVDPARTCVKGRT